MLLGSCWRVTLPYGTMRTPWDLPCGTKLLREFILRISDFLCFAGTNFCDEDKLVFLAGN